MRNGFFISAVMLLLASGCSDVPATPGAALSAKTIRAQQQAPIPPSMVTPPVDDTFERLTGKGQMTNDNMLKVIGLYAQTHGGSQGMSPENVSRMTQIMRQREFEYGTAPTDATRLRRYRTSPTMQVGQLQTSGAGDTELNAATETRDYRDYSRSRYGSVSENSDQTASANNIGAINRSTGEFMSPAGPGGYVGTRDGTLYAPAGPNGVTNTRTGEFIPTNR